jgi:hypothetical protein
MNWASGFIDRYLVFKSGIEEYVAEYSGIEEYVAEYSGIEEYVAKTRTFNCSHTNVLSAVVFLSFFWPSKTWIQNRIRICIRRIRIRTETNAD